jgi:hypothetical protein
VQKRFHASTQYGDWGGEAAADNADQLSLQKYLNEHNLVYPGELLIGTSIYIGENKNGEVGKVHAKAFLFTGFSDQHPNVKATIESLNGPIPVRTVKLTFELSDYVALFKRLHVFMTIKGLSLCGKEFVEAL